MYFVRDGAKCLGKKVGDCGGRRKGSRWGSIQGGEEVMEEGKVK